jgi:uncharacterized membrane protein
MHGVRSRNEDEMELYLLALLIGILAGLRAIAAPAAVSWAAHFGWLDLHATRLALLGNTVTLWILTALAVLELITDQLPNTPSRKAPIQFAARVASGGLCGAAIGLGAGSWPLGLVIGAVGAAIGTLGGYELRRHLAIAFHRDRPAALLEDAVAIGGVLLTMVAVASLR